ncbi:K02A2.6-like [Cordylochernes scorpioides]|uniref:K02A2.6-like n=1 Tax=Cordylochernes scorpioides TaxID=51811 RepID=A0ABY6KGC1_9ARAC|nr:K02A2.6-like [Cordylochernes scorpioides]
MRQPDSITYYNSYLDFSKVDINPNFSNQTISDILHKYKNVFSKHNFDIGHIKTNPICISLLDNIPIAQKPYRTPFYNNAKIQKQITELLKYDIIRPSSSPYSSPALLVNKKSDTPNHPTRLCIDYRKLNQKTVPEHTPIPLIEQIIDRLSKSKIYTILDVKNAYWHIPIDEKDKYKTSFVTQLGCYEWNRLSYGLKNVPSQFERIMKSIFTKHNIHYALNYFDDIIIHSKTYEEHIKHLEGILNVFKQENIKLNLNKYASSLGVAGVLKQLDEQGILHPIGYFSRKLHSYEQNYTASEIETLAIINSVQIFHTYLHNIYFTLHTDHLPLKWIKNVKNPQDRNNVKHLLTSAHHPETNAKVERLNSTIINRLRCEYNANLKILWTKYIPKITESYNETVHTTTGFTPKLLYYGIQPQYIEHDTETHTPIEKARKLAIERTIKSHEHSKQLYYIKHSEPILRKEIRLQVLHPNQEKVEYSDLPSAMRLVPHSDNIPVAQPPENVIFSDDDSDRREQQSDDTNFEAGASSEPPLLTQGNLNDLKGLVMTMIQNSGVYIFVDSSKISLKAVLLHNENKFPSVPIANASNMKETYENMRMLLKKIEYERYGWKICSDLKIHFLHSHLDFFPDNLGAVSDEHGERFHQDISSVEKRYQEPDMEDKSTWEIWSDKKDEAFGIVITKWTNEQAGMIIARAENELSLIIKDVRTDNRTEFCNSRFEGLFKGSGIHHQLATTYSPQSNGVAERVNRTLIDTARTLLIDSKLLMKFWAEAIATATYIKNCTPHRSIKHDTPMQRWNGRKPSVKHIRIFGCLTHWLESKPRRNKFSPKGRNEIFIGYSIKIKAYRIYDIMTKRIHEVRSVIFSEDKRGIDYANDIREYTNCINLTYKGNCEEIVGYFLILKEDNPVTESKMKSQDDTSVKPSGDCKNYSSQTEPIEERCVKGGKKKVETKSILEERHKARLKEQ